MINLKKELSAINESTNQKSVSVNYFMSLKNNSFKGMTSKQSIESNNCEKLKAVVVELGTSKKKDSEYDEDLSVYEDDDEDNSSEDENTDLMFTLKDSATAANENSEIKLKKIK